MLIATLSSRQSHTTDLYWYFSSRQLDHMKQESKVCCGCCRPNCPYQDVHLQSQKRASQMWTVHLPYGNENLPFGVSKCSKCGKHPADFISILKEYHFTVFKEERQKYHWRFSLTVHPVLGYEVICSALWHFRLGIGHLTGVCYIFIYTNVELWTL